MAEAIKKPASDELQKFDKLPVAKPKIESPKDAVSEFLERASTQEASEREAESRKNADPVVQAAHKEVSMVDEGIESNPLTELYLKQHPNLLNDAK